jgi:hypothetical protein
MDLFRNLCFFLGDFRWSKHIPFFTFGVDHPYIDFNEASVGLSLAKPGDIGLHQDCGFPTNTLIPGAFKHSWIFDKDNQIIEAVSEGVIKRHAFHPMYSDWVLILRPRNISQQDIDLALEAANSIIGCEYDVRFKINTGVERSQFQKVNSKKTGFSKRANGKFYCHEVCAFSWWHKREQLGLKRQKHAGKTLFLGDNFITANFDVIWSSRMVSPEWCRAQGMDEHGVQKIAEYLRISKREI